MARSRRSTSIASVTTTGSEKQDKRHANRNSCSAVQRVLKGDGELDAAVLPVASASLDLEMMEMAR